MGESVASTGSADGLLAASSAGSAVGAPPTPNTKRTLRAQSSVRPSKFEEIFKKVSSQTVSADKFKTFEGLTQLAKEHVQHFKSVQTDGHSRPLGPGRTITIATACTGSAFDLVAFATCAAALEEENPGTKFKYLFNCESKERKREWIVDMHKKMGHLLNRSASGAGDDDDVPCCFIDIMDLKNKTAYCAVHDKKCKVRRADVGMVCTSCKDISSQNPQKCKENVFNQQKNWWGVGADNARIDGVLRGVSCVHSYLRKLGRNKRIKIRFCRW